MNRIENVTIVPNVKSFIKSFCKLFIYNRLASVFSAVISIITARFLGPAEFGRIGLVGNMSTFIFIPILIGAHNSLYKFLPDSGEEQRQKLMSTAFVGSIITSVFFGGIFFGLTPVISKSIHILPGIWRMGVMFTIVLAFSIITESFLRGQMKYSTIGKLKLAGTGVFFILILLFFLVLTKKKADFITFYLCNIVSIMFFVLLAIWKSGVQIRKSNLSWNTAKQIYSLGTIVMINMFFIAILNSSDLFMVNYLYPGRDVGIYNVYQGFVKNLFAIIFFEVFAVIFLPTIASMDKTILHQKINKCIYWLLPVIVFLTGIITALTVFMFGKEYVLSFTYIILVSLSIGLYAIFQIDNCIFSMEGNQGAKLCLIPLAVTTPLSLFLQFFLTKLWGITGMMTAVLITNLMLVLLFKIVVYYRYKFVKCPIEK
jgi:O-antigen/teichoic acid export membrane protein